MLSDEGDMRSGCKAASIVVVALTAMPGLAQDSTPAQPPSASSESATPPGSDDPSKGAGAVAAPATSAPDAKNGSFTPSVGAPATVGAVEAVAPDLNFLFMTRREPHVWRTSELIGKDVYGANNERLGEVSDVLVDRNSQVVGVIIGVGGFLGIGDREIALPMRALAFKTSTNPVGRAGTIDDRVVLIATREQLQNAPPFEDAKGRPANPETLTPNTNGPANNTGASTTAPRP